MLQEASSKRVVYLALDSLDSLGPSASSRSSLFSRRQLALETLHSLFKFGDLCRLGRCLCLTIGRFNFEGFELDLRGRQRLGFLGKRTGSFAELNVKISINTLIGR